ncbi:MAG: 1,4-alpha-glucan branching protein GlgB [Fibrobacterales bacterium]
MTESTELIPGVSPLKPKWHDYTTLTQEEIDVFHNKNIHDPFSILGQHVKETSEGKFNVIRVMHPTAYFVIGHNTESNTSFDFIKLGDSGFFEATLPYNEYFYTYELEIFMTDSDSYRQKDPYCYAPLISEFDMHLFSQGTHYELYNILGANQVTHQGVTGILFAVWAPNAQSVSVVGNYNSWDGRRNPMRMRNSGIWELFIPELSAGELYKYEIRSCFGEMMVKIDPYAKFSEMRPNQASVVVAPSTYQWNDEDWVARHTQSDFVNQPMSIYEVHLASWRQKENGDFYQYEDFINELIPYVRDHGFTHIELMPLAEHPLDQSWGYQVTGYYSPTARYGSPEELKRFIDACHANNIGIILDWVPAHFPKDAHALGKFDGSALYEHADARQGEHPDWGTYIFNYGRTEVSNFLIANALYWLKEFHIDGLRVDAVASMLYLDYGREHGQWVPNKYGDNINIEALDFTKHLNSIIRQEAPHALMVAEESTSYPSITKPPEHDGLGYHYKWNMGWMNDFLYYIEKEPIHRQFHQNELTFAMLYAFTENFWLVLSHDEVVHGKGSMINKMPGDDWQKFANLRLTYGFMFAHPGKKLLFMGSEFGQYHEWNADQGLDWHIIDDGKHSQMQSVIKNLNGIYTSSNCLWEVEDSYEGFEWLECDNAADSIVAFARKGRDQNDMIIAIFNFTPVPRDSYLFGVPKPGYYEEIFNSDSDMFGGSNMGNDGGKQSIPEGKGHFGQSIDVCLPPLSATYYRYHP